MSLAELTALHRHVCPRQVLGVRMGLYAGELLGLDLPRPDIALTRSLPHIRIGRCGPGGMR